MPANGDFQALVAMDPDAACEAHRRATSQLQAAVEERDALRAAIQPFLELDYDQGDEWAEACEAARAAHANSYRFTAVEVAEIEVEAGERAEVLRAADPDAPPNKRKDSNG